MTEIKFYPITPKRTNLTDFDVMRLITEGWMSVSNKYRTIARLPEGMTGKEAIIQAGGQAARVCDRWTEEMAKSYFLRCHAHAEGLWLELDENSYRKFRKAGGRAA